MTPAATGDVKVYLAGGVYRLARPLVLDARDSGAHNHRVIYTALPREHPLISGGVQVTGWKLSDASRNLWSAPAPPQLQNSRQLYVDGVRARRTQGRLPVELNQTETGYTASQPAMASWRNPGDIEFVYTGGNAVWSEGSVGLGSWTEPRCPVASIDGAEIHMAQPCWNNSTRRAMLPEWKRTANLVGPRSVGRHPAFVENAFELLGRPGEWYFDRSTRIIYYVPRKGEDLTHADVEAPVLETLIEGVGSPRNPIHDITFSGIQFSYATWLMPSTAEGFSEIQANYTISGPEGYARQGLCDLVPNGTCPYGNWTKTPGNVSFRNDRRIQFLVDTFAHLGAAGLDLGNGSRSDIVQGCVFTDISGNGIELGGVDDPLAPVENFTFENRIANNHIYSIGAEYRGGIAIVVGYAANTTIEHNQLDHLPYAGISIGWGGWPDKIRRAGQANNSRNNVVAHNLIFDFMLVLSDGGGIYTQGLTGPSLAAGEKVAGNVVRDQFSSGHGIYSDNGSCNMTISENVIFNTNFDNWGSRHKDYYDGQSGAANDPLVIENNYWQQGDYDSDKDNVVERNNRLISSLTQAPAGILANAGLQAGFRHILDKELRAVTPADAPGRVAAAPGDRAAYVTWSPPVNTGGAPVTSYTVAADNGPGVRISAEKFARNAYVEVPDLRAGTLYTFTVRANNAAGPSVASLPSLPVSVSDTPVSRPGAPSYADAFAGVNAVSIHFRAPQIAEAESKPPIIAYAVTVNPGGRKVLFRGRRVVVLEGRHTTFDIVDRLESRKTYTFSVAAVSPAGEGPAVTTRPVTIR
ncbi:MAG: fibronectin type III domain-containing protein [Acidobacteriaceae bacterium]|nr:fibronectin type III domain-containing protein [Acidobacteriaceae bacterium]